MILSLFSCACLPSAFLLWKNFYWLLHAFNLCFLMSSLYELLYMVDIKSLICHVICKYFLPFGIVLLFCPWFPLMCSFLFSLGGLVRAPFVCLVRSHLFVFAFVFLALRDGPPKVLLLFVSKSILPMFLSRKIILSSLTFRSLTYLSLFLYTV